MKPAYIPDTVIYGVTDKIPNIKFKKSMKKKKVYVLVCDSTSRGEQEITLNTFDSKEKAVQKMNTQFDSELADWKSWCDEDSLKVENNSKNGMCIYEDGYYCQNHITWEIHEQEVL